MYGLEAWENELFDRYNGEGHPTEEEIWADIYDEDFAEVEKEEAYASSFYALSAASIIAL